MIKFWLLGFVHFMKNSLSCIHLCTCAFLNVYVTPIKFIHNHINLVILLFNSVLPWARHLIYLVLNCFFWKIIIIILHTPLGCVGWNENKMPKIPQNVSTQHTLYSEFPFSFLPCWNPVTPSYDMGPQESTLTLLHTFKNEPTNPKEDN